MPQETPEQYHARFTQAAHMLKESMLKAIAAFESEFNVNVVASYDHKKGLDLTAKEPPRTPLAYNVKAGNTVPLSARQPTK